MYEIERFMLDYTERCIIGMYCIEYSMLGLQLKLQCRYRKEQHIRWGKAALSSREDIWAHTSFVNKDVYEGTF